MATTLSRNLKLRISSNLTADAAYNLNRIDLLGATFLTDSTDTLNIRSQTDIVIEPESADLGGSGVGGSVTVGSANHAVSVFQAYATAINLSAPVGLLDQATGGTKYLRLRYKSDVNGGLDTDSDRTLNVDLEGGDRSLVLAGNLVITGGSLALTVPSSASLILPATGTLSTLAGIETLTGKSIDGAVNVLTNLSNSSIASNASIAYSKLSLSNSIVNSDIATAAGIVYSKLALTGSLLNSDISASAAIARSKLASGSPNYVLINSSGGALTEEPYLARSRGGAGQDQSNVTYPSTGMLVTSDSTTTLTNKTISGASNTLSSIPYSALMLSGSIANADISNTAAIAYSKLALTGAIVNADISATASIARTKLNNGTIGEVVYNDASTGALTSEPNLAITRGGTGAGTATAAITNLLPSQSGQAGKVLSSNGTVANWTAGGVGSVTSVAMSVPAEFTVSGSPITTTGTLAVTKATQLANLVWAGPASGSAAVPTFRAIMVADVPTGIPYSKLDLSGSIENPDIAFDAEIDLSKLESITPNKALASDSSGFITTSATTDTELGYLSGVTSAIQTQFSGKQPLDADLTALAAFSGTGIATRTASNTWAQRSIAAGTGASVTNGDGVSGNPTVAVTLTGLTTDALTEGTSNVYFSVERAQDAVASALTASSEIAWTYNDAANTISAALVTTTVTGASYGSASSVPTYTVDSKGRLTAASNTAILITESQVTNLTTDLAGKVPTTRTITTGTGLSGGGDLSADRTLSISNTAVTAASYGSGSAVATFTVNAQGQLTAAATTSIGITASQVSDFTTASQTVINAYKATATWITGDGTSKAVTHSLGTTDVTVTVYEIDTGATILVDSVVRTTTNVVTLTSSSAPTGSGWKVVISK